PPSAWPKRCALFTGTRVPAEASSCRLCGMPTKPRLGVSVEPGLVRCSTCGHVQTVSDTSGSAKAIQEMFFDDAFASDERFWTWLFDHANANRVARQIQAAARSGRCLEIGPGTGALLDRLRSKGYDVQGLDISEHVARALASRLNIDVAVGTLDASVD